MSLTLLALDASSSACSAALLRRDAEQTTCLARFEMTPRAHTRRLMPMINEVLAEADLAPTQLDAIAFGRGPGAFTGLRIAAGTAQGLAYGLDRPLVGVSTLAALALQAHRRFHLQHLVTALDARMGEIYCASWQCVQDQLTPLSDEAVLAPERLQLPNDQVEWVGVGSGFTRWEAFPAEVQAAMLQHLDDLEPRAEEMAWLAADEVAAGHGQPAWQVQPVYLRNDVAWKKPA
ncbi:tRNA (adenosine(37)-N6)-threonylcarbamoyltransferase complex dimerization subunit type 1 TsaB [Vreelandella aquamarina]|uniref:tRNA (adenosine(37)-N6)-threonylcarbamoyltransferase complex dimerization subunit type 1 TsaB n=1 Tax=Vreelandella aquamarina TaxID=77097 RepID=UPI001193BD3B|nr:tRNA (adenosine(37)-N6)-threonylcarbamoyltransferase complex dimerization subunit type 1 TsaB [Halomonas sp.]TVM04832.1 MAG: tRNA (adenosine(37)-N6)-threonylcarbamoyltransferase complex dimerization subunit type 1 TsaB [Halomonas sp.]